MKFTLSTSAQEKDCIWLGGNTLNELYSMDYLGKCTFKGFIDTDQEIRIVSIVPVDDKLLIFSGDSYTLWIYDKKLCSFQKIVYSNRKNTKLKTVVRKGDSLYAIPVRFEIPVIRMDINSWETDEISWYNKMFDGYDVYSFTEVSEYDDGIMMLTRMTNKIVLIDMHFMPFSVRICSLDEMSNVLCPPFIYKNVIRVVGKNKNGRIGVFSVDEKGNVFEDIFLKEIKMSSDETGIVFSRCCLLDDKVLLLPNVTNRLVVIDLLSMDYKLVDMFGHLDDSQRKINDCCIYDYAYNNDTLFMFSEKIPYIFMMNTISYEMNYLQTNTQDISFEDYTKMCLSIGKVLVTNEDELFSLYNFLGRM